MTLRIWMFAQCVGQGVLKKSVGGIGMVFIGAEDLLMLISSRLRTTSKLDYFLD